MQKTKDKYHNCGGKEKVDEYYQTNKDAIKEKANSKYKNLSEEKKEDKKGIATMSIKIKENAK